MKILVHLIIGGAIVALASYFLPSHEDRSSEELVLPAKGTVERAAW